MAKAKAVEVNVVEQLDPNAKAEGLIRRITIEIAPIVKKALALVIRNDDDLQRAGGFLKMVKGFLNDIADGEIGQIDDATKAARKAAIELRKRAEAPLLQAEGILKPKIAAYQRAEQEREEREKRVAREKAEADAREKAEQEKLDRAQAALDKGDEEQAVAIVEEEVELKHIPTASLGVKEAVKVVGVTLAKTWFAEVDNPLALEKAWREGKVPALAMVCEPNMVFLNKQAVAFKDTNALNYPGVRVCWKDRVGSTG